MRAHSLWVRFSTPTTVPHAAVILAVCAVVTATLVWWRPWKYVRHGVTWVHEGGHAVAALLVGGRIRGMRLNHDTSGRTTTAIPVSNFRQAIVSYWGYPAPAAFGTLLALGVWSGYVLASLAFVALLAIVTVFLIRNWWGLLVVATVGILVGLTAWVIPARYAAWPVVGIATFMLWGSLRSMTETVRARKHRQLDPNDLGNDVYGVSRPLDLPPGFVEFTWCLTWAAAAYGAGWLILGSTVPR